MPKTTEENQAAETNTAGTPVSPAATETGVAAAAPAADVPGKQTLQELLQQKAEMERQQAELGRQIAAFQQQARSGVIAQITKLMADNGIEIADLNQARTAGRRAATSAGTGTGEETRKVAAKYRDPATGSTWTGRGLKPKWLTAAIESGRSQDEFLIDQSGAAAA